MLKKILVALIIIVIILAIILASFWFVSNKNNNTNNKQNNSSLFPLGDIVNILNGNQNDINTDKPTNNASLVEQNILGATILDPIQITNDPVVDFTIISDNNIKKIIYVSQNTGHIYSNNLTEEEIEGVRISNTTISNPIESSFIKNNNFLYTYVRDAQGVIHSIQTDLNNNTSSSKIVNRLISSIPQTNNQDKIFYLENFNNQITGNISNPDFSGVENIFNSKISNWDYYWINSRLINISQPPSYHKEAVSFILNTQNGQLNKVISDESGTTLKVSPDTNYVLYTKSHSDNFDLIIKDLNNLTEKILPIKTQVDKCTWADDSSVVYCAVSDNISRGEYPDDWYQGVLTFNNDNIWAHNPSNNKTIKVADINRNLDIINIEFINGKTFVFQNKKDDTLWQVNLID